MKIYTKTGDHGDTGLLGGKRISKDSLRIEAIGQVDELNATIGLASAHISMPQIQEMLNQIQQDLFTVGADLATPINIQKSSAIRLLPSQTQELESWIDKLQAKLPQLKNFILPGGSISAAQIHFSRTICRRAERVIVSLNSKEKLNLALIPYLNRLSDFLFVLARYLNHHQKVKEEKWQA